MVHCSALPSGNPIAYVDARRWLAVGGALTAANRTDFDFWSRGDLRKRRRAAARRDFKHDEASADRFVPRRAILYYVFVAARIHEAKQEWFVPQPPSLYYGDLWRLDRLNLS
ncbi:MAG: hypothetical protein C4334_01570 [Pyrinomonas sp.]